MQNPDSNDPYGEGAWRKQYGAPTDADRKAQSANSAPVRADRYNPKGKTDRYADANAYLYGGIKKRSTRNKRTKRRRKHCKRRRTSRK